MNRAKTLTMWMSPEEGAAAPEGEAEAALYAARCAGITLRMIQVLLLEAGASSLRVRVCRGPFFVRVVETPEA